MYRTSNAGATWEAKNDHLLFEETPSQAFDVRNIEQDPNDTTVLFSTSRGLYKSINEGIDWHDVSPAAGEMVGVAINSYTANEAWVYSTAVWIYTAMQGSYGLVWILKDTAFPDSSWQRRITVDGE